MRRRPVLGAISGLFFGLFLAVDLLFLGVIPLDNILVTVLPIAFLVVGLALGFRPRPSRKRRSAATI
jgi:hypothetical protein